MKDEDKELKEFFGQMRASEAKEIEIPPFELPQVKRKPSTVRYLLPLGSVAAALFLFFGMDWGKEVVESEENMLVITMTIEEPMNTDEFLSDEKSITEWKSPSDILIQEFED
ncbi:MAG: hypothetical protein AAF489_02150 [Bacteroidota bacterium]